MSALRLHERMSVGGVHIACTRGVAKAETKSERTAHTHSIF